MYEWVVYYYMSTGQSNGPWDTTQEVWAEWSPSVRSGKVVSLPNMGQSLMPGDLWPHHHTPHMWHVTNTTENIFWTVDRIPHISPVLSVCNQEVVYWYIFGFRFTSYKVLYPWSQGAVRNVEDPLKNPSVSHTKKKQILRNCPIETEEKGGGSQSSEACLRPQTYPF